METGFELDEKMVEEAVRLGHFQTRQEALNAALAEYVDRRNRLRILELEGQVDFAADWNYKAMRGKRCE
jgi:hypothetical protein